MEPQPGREFLWDVLQKADPILPLLLQDLEKCMCLMAEVNEEEQISERCRSGPEVWVLERLFHTGGGGRGGAVQVFPVFLCNWNHAAP